MSTNNEQIIQAAVDWNIKQREVAKLRKDYRNARRYQRNIDELNAKLRSFDTQH